MVPRWPERPRNSDPCSRYIEQATYWTDAASMATYAWAYVKALLTGKSPSADEIVTEKSVSF
jgi:hypothetical protein